MVKFIFSSEMVCFFLRGGGGKVVYFNVLDTSFLVFFMKNNCRMMKKKTELGKLHTRTRERRMKKRWKGRGRRRTEFRKRSF